jgi:hypothetical protein
MKKGVRGTRFTTTRDTLLSIEDTYFSVLLSGNFQVCNCDREKERGRERKRKGKKEEGKERGRERKRKGKKEEGKEKMKGKKKRRGEPERKSRWVATTRDTLLSVEDTYFSTLFSGNFKIFK